MKKIQTSYSEYVVTSDACGDCTKCPSPCENGEEMLLNIWTPEEVAQICGLLGKQ